MGLTRARRRAKIYFASNRRIHGLWNSTVPSRFVDDLPETDVEMSRRPPISRYGGGYGGSRFDRMPPSPARPTRPPAGSAPRRTVPATEDGGYSGAASGDRRGPMMIEGELVAKSAGPPRASAVGGRVLHTKFGPGTVEAVDGNKLTVEFDKAGRKMVLDSFVEALG